MKTEPTFDEAAADADGSLTLTNIHRRLKGKPFGRLADLVTGIAMLTISGVSFLYAANVPGFDPLTVWPFAIWTAIFVALGLLLSPLLRRRRTGLVVGYALLVGLLLSEEPWFVLRELWHDPSSEIRAARQSDELLRVVSLNCRGGNIRAVEDALKFDPDIVLLQESPGQAEVERILPPGWTHSGQIDASVIVRGSMAVSPHPKWLAHEMYGVRAVPVRLGRPITVISTHLVLPSLRTDIWRPEVWRKAAEIRGARMRIVEELLVQRDRYGDDLPVIVGGDFNTRAGDSLLQPLIANGMTDVFDAVGHGWPNTMTAEFPIARIDFIWVGEQVEPLNAQVATTPHSDHRMVVAEVAVRQPAAHLTYSPSSSRSSRR